MHSVAFSKTFQTMCSDLDFFLGQKWAGFEKKTLDYKWMILSKSGRFEHFELNT